MCDLTGASAEARLSGDFERFFRFGPELYYDRKEYTSAEGGRRNSESGGLGCGVRGCLKASDYMERGRDFFILLPLSRPNGGRAG